MRMYYLLLTSIAVVLLNGCSFNVPLLSAPKPLKEKVVEGEGRKKILILDVTGVISEREKAGGLLVRGSSSMVDLTREALKKAEEDDDLAAVIVRINSPGGTVTASDIIRHDIQAFKERKKVPVYACIMSIGASGAYYIATAADQIVAHPTAITGSIGVLRTDHQVGGQEGHTLPLQGSHPRGATPCPGGHRPAVSAVSRCDRSPAAQYPEP